MKMFLTLSEIIKMKRIGLNNILIVSLGMFKVGEIIHNRSSSMVS